MKKLLVNDNIILNNDNIIYYDSTASAKYFTFDENKNITPSLPERVPNTEKWYRYPCKIHKILITDNDVTELIDAYKQVTGRKGLPDPEFLGVCAKNDFGENAFVMII